MRFPLCQRIVASLFAAATAFGAGAIGHPAIASAEWDIGAYDECMDDVGLK